MAMNPGPAGALAPVPPPRPMPESPVDERRERLIRAGLRDKHGNLSPDYVESCTIFDHVATIAPSPASGEPTIDSARFQAIMRQRVPDWSARALHAAFQAADVDRSTLLNRHEFAMLRRALETFDPARDAANNDLIEIRCRALFAMHMSSDNELNAAARRKLVERVRDLCGRSSDVDRVLAALGLPLDDTAAPMTYAQFAQAVQQGTLMTLASLNIGDPPATERTTSLKVDDRQVVMEQAAAGGPHRAASNMAGPKAVAPDMRLDPELCPNAGDDWRGALAAPRGTERFRIAQLVVENARALSNEISTQPDVDHRDWMPGSAALERLLDRRRTPELAQLSPEYMIGRLCEHVKRIAIAQPMVVQVPAPAKVFGDIHGQLRDLLMLFCRYGFPSHHGGDIETTSYVFNGDWVDRGAHQLEVVVLLFALKTLYPARVFLIRGNHEFRSQSEGMGLRGFRHHVKHHPAFSTIPDRGLVGVYERIHASFDWLPLAARVGGVVLVLHGGIGDGSWTVDDLAAVRRPLSDESDADVPPCASQALWSDPADSDAVMAHGVHTRNSTSKGLNMQHVGAGIPGFGADVTRRFCAREGLKMVVRSHQFVPEGAKYMHGGHLVTLFSARNYCDGEQNDSALLLFANNELGELLVRVKRLAHRLTPYDA
jgi:diadenosine tetraphosphatase ApaH/serine/threonine PP2A family protein phosphatase